MKIRIPESLFPVFCFFFILLSIFSASTVPAKADQSAGARISLENRTSFYYRSTGGRADADFYNHWYLRGRNLLNGRVSFYFSGRLHKDIDGSSTSQADDPYAGIEDLEPDWEGQIYQIYGDLHTTDRRLGLRLGRQYIESADALHIDGGLLRLFDKEPVNLRLFMGRPVSYYDGTVDDWAGGASLSARPCPGNRSRFTYIRYNDTSAGEKNDHYTLDIRQRFNDAFRSHIKGSVLDEDYETALLTLSYFPVGGTFDAYLTLQHWDGLQQESLEYSPLYGVFGDLEPYTYLSARGTWIISPMLSISPAVAGRFVNASNRGDANRQYGHYDLTLTVTPAGNWTFSLAGEYWDVNRGDRFWGLTGEVECRSFKNWRINAGTAYLDYRYRYPDYGFSLYSGGGGDIAVVDDDAYTQISPDVYSVFTRIRYRINDSLSLRLRGEFEDNSIESNSYGIRTTLVLKF